MAAEAGNIYRSDDGGQTWKRLPSPYDGSFFGTLPLKGKSILAFGLRGHLFRSRDGGNSWSAVETGTTAMLTDGVFLKDGTIVIVGLGGVVLESQDGGESFQLHQLFNRRGIQAVVPAGPGRLLMVGEFGVATVPVSDQSGTLN